MLFLYYIFLFAVYRLYKALINRGKIDLKMKRRLFTIKNSIMEKISASVVLLLLFITTSCKTNGVATHYRDDFKSVSEKEKTAFLKEQNATSNNRSVLVLTQGFKGEKISAKQEDKAVYSSYPITNLNTKLADYFSFSNETELLIYDQFTKKEIVISSEKSQKYKFIYLMKEYKDDTTDFSITYSNTLRPLK